MLARAIGRITHPIRTGRAALARAQVAIDSGVFDPIEALKRRSERQETTAGISENIVDCAPLEMSLASFDASRASHHLKKLGVLLVRGDEAIRASIRDYMEFLDSLGYCQQGVPRGGGLWQFQSAPPFRFHVHEIVQKRFYSLCRHYLGCDVILSAAGTIGTVRTVASGHKGIIPFHQDISPVVVRNSLTF